MKSACEKPSLPLARRRRRSRYVFPIVLICLVGALPFLWTGLEFVRRRSERKLIEEIKASEGYAVYEKTDSASDDWQPALKSLIAWLATGEGDQGHVRTLSWDLVPPNLDYQPLVRKCVQRFQKLESLELDGTNVNDSLLLDIGRLPDLQYLDLNRTKVTDAGLEHLANMWQLRALHLDLTEVSDAGLLYIATLPNLQELTIRGTRVSPAALADFRDAHPNVKVEWAPRLGEDVMVGVSELRKKGWETTLAWNEQDTKLDVRISLFQFPAPELGETDRRLLDRLPPFQATMFSPCSARTLKVLATCPQLEDLFLDCGDGERLKEITSATQLKKLRLGYCNMSDEGWANLRKMQSLEHLSIDPAEISSPVFSHIGALHSLKVLRISWRSRPAEHLAQLSNLINLEELYIDATAVPAEELRHLQSLKRLKTICLGARLDHAAFECLKELPALERLKLHQIWDEDLLKIAKIPSLRALDYGPYAANVSSAGLNEFQDLRPDVKINTK